jgi:hypothetical protein
MKWTLARQNGTSDKPTRAWCHDSVDYKKMGTVLEVKASRKESPSRSILGHTSNAKSTRLLCNARREAV